VANQSPVRTDNQTINGHGWQKTEGQRCPFSTQIQGKFLEKGRNTQNGKENKCLIFRVPFHVDNVTSSKSVKHQRLKFQFCNFLALGSFLAPPSVDDGSFLWDSWHCKSNTFPLYSPFLKGKHCCKFLSCYRPLSSSMDLATRRLPITT
jgi:hypothetical protein